jgi:peptidoglycan L-alanyl-D-glutamate endopeptidase CwlK
MYSFGEKSQLNLDTAHESLQQLCNEVIKHIDFSVIEGHRPIERQIKLYNQGKSQIDGINKKGKHNYTPSLAVDVIPYEKGHNPFDESEKSEYMFLKLNREFQKAAKKLNIQIEWGGSWATLDDMPHYQLVTSRS